jgi:hypothetical protein
VAFTIAILSFSSKKGFGKPDRVRFVENEITGEAEVGAKVVGRIDIDGVCDGRKVGFTVGFLVTVGENETVGK